MVVRVDSVGFWTLTGPGAGAIFELTGQAFARVQLLLPTDSCRGGHGATIARSWVASCGSCTPAGRGGMCPVGFGLANLQQPAASLAAGSRFPLGPGPHPTGRLPTAPDALRHHSTAGRPPIGRSRTCTTRRPCGVARTPPMQPTPEQAPRLRAGRGLVLAQAGGLGPWRSPWHGLVLAEPGPSAHRPTQATQPWPVINRQPYPPAFSLGVVRRGAG
jgi:hypothetical protein